MWNINGQIAAKERFEPFTAVEVLDDYDGPRIFTLKDSDGELNLACWSDGDKGNSRFVVAPTTTKILDSLRTGEISVFDALNQPRCWVCDVSADGDVGKCWRVDFDSILRDALPSADTRLLASLEPLLVDEVLADQVHFSLSPERWDAFCAALDAPPKVIPALRRLLKKPSVFHDDAA